MMRRLAKPIHGGLALALLLGLAMPGVARADNVQNDVVAGGNDTFFAGASTTVNYRITANSGDGQSGCNASDGSPATVTITAPAAVTASPSSLTFTACGTNGSVVFSSATPGDYTVTVGVADTGAGTYNVSPARFTLHVLAAPAPSDTTPPLITPNVSGTLGTNGWYVSDVLVTWSVVDGESTVSSTSGCDAATINADTAGTTLTCTATSAGGASSASVTIKRDSTAPTISGSASPAPNGNGWNNSDVTVTFTCSDSVSGLVSCGPDQTLSDEAAGQSATGVALDGAGNSASGVVGGISIDKTPPTVALVGGPAGGGSYYFGSVPAAPACTANDSLSGLDGSCSLSGYSAAVGTHTVKANATDNAGNYAEETASYTVLAWTLSGFYQPVEMGEGVWNTVKGGATVPLKFEVFAGPTELTDVAAVSTLTKQVFCNAGAEDTVDVLATGGTSLRYDTTAGRFVFNWQTPKQPGKCYEVRVTTQDGSSIVAFFKLR